MTTTASAGSPFNNAPNSQSASQNRGGTLPPHLQKIAGLVANRLRGRRVVLCGAWGLGMGASATLLAVVALRLRLWEMPENIPDLLLAAPPLAGVLAGAAWGAVWKISPLAALRYADTRLGLHERLSTAASAYLAPAAWTNSEWAERQKEDARVSAQTADARAIVPLRPLPRPALWALGVALAAFLVWFLPTLPLFQSAQTRAEHKAVQAQGERLVRLAKALDKDAGKKKLPEAHKAALAIAALGKQLQKSGMTKQKALMKVAKLTAAMKQAQMSLAAQTGVPKSLPTAGKDLAQALANAQATPKQSKDDQKNGGLNAPPPGTDAKAGNGKTSASGAENAKKMQQALAENNPPSLAEQLGKMAADAEQGKPGDKAGQEEMAKQVAALADALKNTSLSAASAPLQKAANALQKGDLQAAAKALREAAKKIGAAQSKSADAEAMQKMAQALGQSATGQDGQEGAQMDGTGEGEGKGDAFGKNGLKKGEGEGGAFDPVEPDSDEYVWGKGKGQGDGTGGYIMGGDGENGSNINAIGSGAGKLGGKKPATTPAGKYLDAKYGPKGNASLNRKTQKNEVRDDQFSRLFVPGPNATKLTGKRGENGKETTSFFRGAPDKANSSVPYYEVYGRYAPAAESALSRDDIPQSYKKQVKSYFDSLRPAGK